MTGSDSMDRGACTLQHRGVMEVKHQDCEAGGAAAEYRTDVSRMAGVKAAWDKDVVNERELAVEKHWAESDEEAEQRRCTREHWWRGCRRNTQQQIRRILGGAARYQTAGACCAEQQRVFRKTHADGRMRRQPQAWVRTLLFQRVPKDTTPNTVQDHLEGLQGTDSRFHMAELRRQHDCDACVQQREGTRCS